MSHFVLSIELGNDAMRRPRDVARALQEVAERLRNLDQEGRIRDLNGNTVGSWKFNGEEGPRR